MERRQEGKGASNTILIGGRLVAALSDATSHATLSLRLNARHREHLASPLALTPAADSHHLVVDLDEDIELSSWYRWSQVSRIADDV